VSIQKESNNKFECFGVDKEFNSYSVPSFFSEKLSSERYLALHPHYFISSSITLIC